MIKSGKRVQLNLPWWRVILIVLLILAVILSVFLSWHFLAGGSMIGCSSGSACDHVLNSRWSMIADLLPVSGLAIGVYLAMLFAVFYIGQNTELAIRRLSWKIMLVLAGAVSGGAVWFIIIQKWIVGEFCFYCMTTHIAGLIISSLVFWRVVKEPYYTLEDKLQHDKTGVVSSSIHVSIIRPLHATGLALTGLLLAIIMAVSQIVFAQSAFYLDGKSQQNLPALDYKTAPAVGLPDAPHVVALLFDYQCSHCQKIHFMINEVVRRYKGKLAFVLCPTPLNTQCNPYVPRDVDAFKNSCELARIGLAVWLAEREEFSAFENWMFTYESGNRWGPRNLEAARIKAVELVGQEKFDAALSNQWIEQYMRSCVQLFGSTMHGGNGGIPKLIYGSRWVIPETSNVDDLMSILQKSLALPQP